MQKQIMLEIKCIQNYGEVEVIQIKALLPNGKLINFLVIEILITMTFICGAALVTREIFM